MDSLNNKDLIYQISYEVYDPILRSANFLWTSPIVTFNATLNKWKFDYWKDLLSLKQLTPGIDVGNKWLEKVLWPAYKRALSNRYYFISNNLNNSTSTGGCAPLRRFCGHGEEPAIRNWGGMHSVRTQNVLFGRNARVALPSQR